MAFQSFFERVTVDAHLPASIRAAAELADVCSVYVGIRPRPNRSDVDVILVPDELEDLAEGAPHLRTLHRLRAEIHVRHRAEASTAGAEAARVLRRFQEAVRLHFRDRRPWQPDLPDVLDVDVELVPQMRDENTQAARGALLFRILVEGDGAVSVGAGEGEFGGQQ